MKKIICVYLIFMISACTLFKQSSKVVDERFDKAITTTHEQIEKTVNRQQNEQQFFIRADSSDSDYSIRLWPKGSFTFSPNSEITGEFDSVHLVGKHKRIRSTAEMLSNTGTQKEVKRGMVSTQKREESEKKRVEKVKTPQKTLLIFLIALLGLFLSIRIFLWVKSL